MPTPSSDPELLAAFRAGNEAGADVLFRRYVVRLTALVRARLSRRLARRVDPEDVVLSAYRSFFLGVRDGRFSLADDAGLWPLLATVVLRKLAHQSRRNTAQRRDVARESSDAAGDVHNLVAADPGPEQAALVADEIERALSLLDPTGREVLVRQMQGFAAAEIAAEIGCSERTVRRASERIRALLGEDRAGALPTASAAIDAEEPPTGDYDPAVARPRDDASESRSDVACLVRPTRVFSDVVLHELVGRGAFGKVYRATDCVLRRMVAVKFLQRRFWDDPRSRTALQTEFAALSALRHPHIVAVHGWGTTPAGAAFLVMDWIRGETSDVWVRRAGPTPRSVLAAVAPICDALEFAHRGGWIHGDLKPANVLRTEDGRCVLADFGMARRIGPTSPTQPTGGTAGFLSPEQISDAFGDIGPRSDVYGLGALLYALLTGRAPFVGRDVPETLAAVLSAAVPDPPSRSNPQVPPEVDALVRECVAKEPAERPGSAETVGARLRSIVERTA